MEDEDDLVGIALRIIDENRYMTLATVGDDGLPWASPVFFATDNHVNYY